jgi:hypothetical protein
LPGVPGKERAFLFVGVKVWIVLTKDPLSTTKEIVKRGGGGDYFLINPIIGMTPANYPSPQQLPQPTVSSDPK